MIQKIEEKNKCKRYNMHKMYERLTYEICLLMLGLLE